MNSTTLNIFYTDDDVDDQDIFKQVAHEVSSNLQVITQGDGDELIKQLQNTSLFPNVILLDLNMPKKDGYEVLKEIRLSNQTKNIPVVIFTTTNDEKVISTTRQLGADLFITKPSTISSLKNIIRHIISINWEHFSTSDENYVYRTN